MVSVSHSLPVLLFSFSTSSSRLCFYSLFYSFFSTYFPFSCFLLMLLFITFSSSILFLPLSRYLCPPVSIIRCLSYPVSLHFLLESFLMYRYRPVGL
ncbi:hypothetical protein GGS23DRAFT_240477 [Durotheca rogersii]|uniref:uncharacterized protein n=1 Tax=Durotheca rogersii TaxID=419775 RepID=UPI00221FB1FB|nr:uncharacterized protein GGS23DRAFT_240477 [Durotheca rogersii]KAI5860226.1 hypothetical protein GGS23DRAFT_240477 [Durotheca rogersii]